MKVNGLVESGRLLALADKFGRKRILVVGDLMLDHFIRGRVQRISPEAPVPVVAVGEESHAPGGAGNVCSNLTALGAAVSVISAVGRDQAAQLLLADLRARGVDTGAIVQDAARVTTQKCRVVADHQQVVRFDRETPQGLAPQFQSEILAKLRAGIRQCHALVLSDYGKGIVTPQLLSAAIRAARQAGVPVLVDPKVEHFRRYRGVDCITPNLPEAYGGMRALPPKGERDVEELGRRIVRILRVRSLLITRGEKGMSLFESRGNGSSPIRHIPTQAREVFDVTGAGDTVISVMALALASGARYLEAAVIANLAAGIVVGKLGTATVSVQEIKRAVLSANNASRTARMEKGLRVVLSANNASRTARMEKGLRVVRSRS